MWKKKENEPPAAKPPQPRPQTPAARPTAPPRRSERAVIGPTLRVEGQVFGEEELLIQGQVDGKVQVKGQAVTVGKSGRVKADIHARTIRVEGTVRGDLYGEQEVIIETSGNVAGNLIAPGVRLENGATFKGSIDMDKASAPQAAVATVSKPTAPGTPKIATGGATDETGPGSTPSPQGQPPLRR